MTTPNQQFSISAKTCTLLQKVASNHGSILDNQTQYIIPIYQRPYSWKKEQLKKFIDDIFSSFIGLNGASPEEPMFIGTMQLSTKKDNGEQEIIDGQQRLTTFLLFIKMLQHKFSETNLKIAEIPTNWLRTKVNSGKQQEDLDVFLKNSSLAEYKLNSYFTNAQIIAELIDEHTKQEDDTEKPFNIDDFVTYLCTGIYFVVIETRAGLSKTLQIFNAINTTGLDLNGGDIFKIRMYEYLHDKKGKNEDVFDEISALYEKIDTKNKESNSNVSNIESILKTYQYFIIAKYKLPTTLYGYGSNRFFEQLFDTILNVNQWDLFKNNVHGVDLSIEEIDQIIEVRYLWEKKWKNKDKEGFNAEDVCAYHFIWWSRYSHYWDLTFLFLYKNQNEKDKWSKLLIFIRQLSKLFFIYSIRFQKIKNDIYYGFMHNVISHIVNNNADEVIALINNKIGKLENHKGGYDLEHIINGDIVYNTRMKDLICRMAAMLEYNDGLKTADIKSVEMIFTAEIDIEHIQSYNDKDESKRSEIWEQWGTEINSLGNLMLLERTMNRSIGNKPYNEKVENYKEKSKFLIVKNQAQNYPDWSLEKAKERKEIQVKKILTYLFNHNV